MKQFIEFADGWALIEITLGVGTALFFIVRSINRKKQREQENDLE